MARRSRSLARSQPAETIADPYRRAETLASIARVQTLIGESASDRTIHQALAAVAQIREPAFRDWVLNDVVLAQIAAEDLVGARETANRIEAKRQQGAALAQIATVELRAGNVAGAQQTGRCNPRTRSEERDPAADRRHLCGARRLGKRA